MWLRRWLGYGTLSFSFLILAIGAAYVGWVLGAFAAFELAIIGFVIGASTGKIDKSIQACHRGTRLERAIAQRKLRWKRRAFAAWLVMLTCQMLGLSVGVSGDLDKGRAIMATSLVPCVFMLWFTRELHLLKIRPR